MKTTHLTAALLPVLLITGCRSDKNETTPIPPVKVELLSAIPETHSIPQHYSGTVEEENGTPLSFAIAGTVQEVHIHLGQQVHAGQVIATLDPTNLQNHYDAAYATLKQAEDAYRRMKELHDKGSLPDIKWVEAESQLAQARSLEQIAAKQLKDCQLLAPSDGIIAEKNIEAGQNVLPGSPVAQLVNTSLLKIKIAVPETEISAISTGQNARISVPALGDKTFQGKVVEKGIVAHPLSRSYDVKIQVANHHEGLMPGMVAEVVLHAPQNTATQYIIPAHIVQLDEHNQTFVWTVEQGKAHKRFIQVGAYSANGVSVLSGLKAGDNIIAKGQQKVCEGTEVCL